MFFRSIISIKIQNNEYYTPSIEPQRPKTAVPEIFLNEYHVKPHSSLPGLQRVLKKSKHDIQVLL